MKSKSGNDPFMDLLGQAVEKEFPSEEEEPLADKVCGLLKKCYRHPCCRLSRVQMDHYDDPSL